MPTRRHEDITGKIGSVFQTHTPEWPMYSFTRPAHAFWQGIADGLAEQGKTDADIKEILQSKHMHWLFDGMAFEEIQAMGKYLALHYGKDWEV